MDVKLCTRCKKYKPILDFNFKNKYLNIRQYHCKNCSRTYIRTHYLNNRKYYLKKARIRNNEIKREIRQYTWEYLNTHPCIDCGESDPVVLEFDHQSDKIADISTMYRNFTLEKVKNEISKCQVRCANCHRRKTAKDYNWYKNIMPL